MTEQFTASATISMVEYLELKEDAKNFKELKETLASILYWVKYSSAGPNIQNSINQVLKDSRLKYTNISIAQNIEGTGNRLVVNIGAENGNTLKLDL